MFGIDGPEFIVILIVLIVVVGPKDLPKMLKAIGKATARMRTTANEFRRQFDEAMHEAELDDLQKTLTDVKDLNPRKKLTEIFDRSSKLLWVFEALGRKNARYPL